jgi:CheY-like chemotaxis protein
MAQPAILVVEPRAARAERLIDGLATLGLTDHVTICSTGRDAIDQLFRSRPDPGRPRPAAILIDLDASLADGAEVARRIRSTDRFASVPIVLLTEYPSPSLRAAATRLRATLVPTLEGPDDLERIAVALGRVGAVRAAA